MTILNYLKLLAIGSLVAAAIANPVERRFENDDDDTPLPLVIWHGKRAINRQPETQSTY